MKEKQLTWRDQIWSHSRTTDTAWTWWFHLFNWKFQLDAWWDFGIGLKLVSDDEDPFTIMIQPLFFRFYLGISTPTLHKFHRWLSKSKHSRYSASSREYGFQLDETSWDFFWHLDGTGMSEYGNWNYNFWLDKYFGWHYNLLEKKKVTFRKKIEFLGTVVDPLELSINYCHGQQEFRFFGKVLRVEDKQSWVDVEPMNGYFRKVKYEDHLTSIYNKRYMAGELDNDYPTGVALSYIDHAREEAIASGIDPDKHEVFRPF